MCLFLGMVIQLSIKLASTLVLLGRKRILSTAEAPTSVQKSCTGLLRDECGCMVWQLAGRVLSVCWTQSFDCVAKALSQNECSLCSSM